MLQGKYLLGLCSLGLAYAATLACFSAGGANGCAVGSEGCTCTEGGGCDDGLTCQMNMCEATNADDADVGTDSESASVSAGDADTSTDGTSECIDLDQDGHGNNCEMGADCNDEDPYNYTPSGCANCVNIDQDDHWFGCDVFDQGRPGPDCDDGDFNVFSAEGCLNCTDNDLDGIWVGCDQYSEMKPGPDCDDSNPDTGSNPVPTIEICNGLSENCAGEIDNAPPSEMCPPEGIDAPNVADQNGWGCVPPAPGQDGCIITNCDAGYHDLDGEISNGCECRGDCG